LLQPPKRHVGHRAQLTAAALTLGAAWATVGLGDDANRRWSGAEAFGNAGDSWAVVAVTDVGPTGFTIEVRLPTEGAFDLDQAGACVVPQLPAVVGNGSVSAVSSAYGWLIGLPDVSASPTSTPPRARGRSCGLSARSGVVFGDYGPDWVFTGRMTVAGMPSVS
jgi:hypothetical protein